MTLILKSKELVLPKGQDLVSLFKGKGLNDLLTKIEQRIRSHVPDTSTPVGRKAIASNAYLASRTKTTLDKAALLMTKDWRDKITKTNKYRTIVTERLDALKVEAREPLTQWELEESARIEAAAHAVQYLEDWESALVFNGALDVQLKRWQELEDKELEQKAERKRLAEIEADLVEQANKIALKEEERKRKIREEEALKQQKEESRLAEIKRQEDAAKQKIADKKVAEEQAERLRQETIKRATQHALDLKNQAARAEQEKQEGIATARLEEQEKARKLELVRQAKEDEERAEQIAREADQVHREKINDAAVFELEELLVKSNDFGRIPRILLKAISVSVVGLIVAGKVPNVTIEY